MISRLAIRNYKSLRDVNLDSLTRLNVLVGANASGKSNLVDALDFLAHVLRSGLASAVRAKGGYENICFRRMKRSSAPIEFEVTAEVPSHVRRRESSTREYRYAFGFKATRGRISTDYRVVHENIWVGERGEAGGECLLRIERVENRLADIHVSKRAAREIGLPSTEVLTKYLLSGAAPDELLGPVRLAYFGPFMEFARFMGGCRVYQIYPEATRGPGVPELSPEMGRHGENLPAAVEYLERQEPGAFQELVEHLRYSVSTIEAIETGYVETKELGVFFRERGVGRRWYSQDVSDGTMKTVGMFLPLVDPRVRVVVIEEPENCLHPWIIRHFVEVCQSHSASKQIWLTSHSPLLLNSIPVDSLFLVRRVNGETRLDKARRVEPILDRIVREELYGLGDYWVSGGLGAVPEPPLPQD